MNSFGGSLNTRFSFDNSSRSLVSNDNKNEERKWDLFEFNNGVESPKQSFITPFYTSSFTSTNPNQFLDPPFFSFNSNIISSSGSYSDIHFKEEKANETNLNFQSQTWPTSSSISGNKKEESTKCQALDWNVESQQKPIDFSIEISKTEPESIQSPQRHSNFNSIQATNEQNRYHDGYNWRKYGQKQIKRSNNPQSYYKCTYPNCPTKKKVEKDLNGFITKIIYKEKHNHTMPTNVQKSSSNSFNNTIFEHSNRFQPYSECSFIEHEQEQGSSICESRIDHENEPEAKRWKLDEVESEAISSSLSKTLEEPRLVVETKSDIDILDDGYRWRKYGQKVVKGNMNPRSYYKCTYVGCRVRKLVERASHDFQSVITTYEAKHNHSPPMSRRGGNYAINQASTSTTTTTSSNCGVVISRPLPNYSNNFHGRKGSTISQTHILQTFENSTNYIYSEKFLSESSTGLLVSSTKKEPESDFIFNSF
ncbi:unnamed protein product [Lactuca saligna]|uniref:WRKY domain-containing protein n=1 Tax=Lactuca saligna TaxID=75948 RepID=A0AA36A0A5_LACSI|nr:unnamed protein product [Lactuca saligna]